MVQFIFILLSFVLFLEPICAQDEHIEDGDPHHDSVIHLGPIDVLGDSESSNILHTIPTVSNLHGDQLFKKSQSSLGETLRSEVGVNASQFGPAASRPVIRGLEGDRIRILQNGIGVLDASGTSQDHAVPIHPLSAESVEIVRGPISLLYGSSAVGGVVNVVNSRIHKDYLPGFFGVADGKVESVNNGRTIAAKADYGVDQFMFHIDGNYNKADNTQTPVGEIQNSELEQHSLAVGTTWFSKNKNYLGVSYSTFQNIYGVVSESDVDITLKQDRIDLAGYYQLGGFFKAVRLKSAQTFYKHTEFESGESGTVFDNNGNETRVEFLQNNKGPWHGIVGLQSQYLELSALGEEAFLPTTDKKNLALFIFEELEFEKTKFNLGLRGEGYNVSVNDPNFTVEQSEKNYFMTSAALGAAYMVTPITSTTLNLSYNERAPTYQELYSNGPHMALGAYEQGDVNLNKEKSYAVEWSLKRNSARMFTVLTLFNQEFDNFISMNPSGVFADTDDSGVAGDSDEDFQIYNYQATKARINGIEFEALHRIRAWWSLGLKFDYLYGQNTETHKPLPRISPMRLALSVNYEKDAWASSLSWKNVFKQSRVAPGETATDSYNLVDFDVSYKMKLASQNQLRLYAQANNLTDSKARNHVSIIKDRVLLPGRNFILGARYLF